MIRIELSKQQALDADPEGIQQINFTGNLEIYGNKNIALFFIIDESKETISEFSQQAVKAF